MTHLIMAATLAWNAHAADLDSLRAAAADTTVALRHRIQAARAAARMDDSGLSHLRLARLYMRAGEPQDAAEARNALTNALERDNRNPDILVAMAEFFWRIDARTQSIRYARRAVEADPSSAEGYYWIGRFGFWEMTRYLNAERWDVNKNTDPMRPDTWYRLDLSEYGEEPLSDARANLARALELAPGHEEARRHLALVHYITGEADELVALFREKAASDPDSRSMFVLGLAYQLRGDLDRAHRYYARALELLDPEDRTFMLSVFTTPDHEDTLAVVPSGRDIARYWTARDPLRLTPINERLLEQCRRVAYADLRFSVPEKGIRGWRTDRGQAFIRFGDPLTLATRPGEYHTGVDEPSAHQERQFASQDFYGTSPVGYRFPTETWTYENFRIVFENTDMHDGWRFGAARLGIAQIGFGNLVERVPERYVDPYAYARYSAPYQAAQFRGNDGRTRVEIYYGLHASRVEATEASTGARKADLHKGLFLFNALWDTIKVDRTRVSMLPWIDDAVLRDGILVAGEWLTLEPGGYNLVGEVEDRGSGSFGTFQTKLDVRSFAGDTLQMSDILFARRVVERADRPFGRARYAVLPNPIGAVTSPDRAHFYLEVYNLQRDDFGTTHYNVSYQSRITSSEEDTTTAEWVTTVSQDVSGDTAWEPLYLSLDVKDAAPGAREFRVVVTDSLSGKSASSTTRYLVRW